MNMFCPKCGKELPDGSAFCGGCGAKLGAKAAPSGAPASNNPQQANTSQGGSGSIGSVLNKIPSVKRYSGKPMVLLFEVIAALAIVCTIFPWFEVNSSIASLSSGVAGVASFFGASQGSFSFEDEYFVWALPDLASTLSDYLSLYGSLGGSSKASSSSSLITTCSWLCVILWIASIVAGIAGDIISRKTHDYKLLNSACGGLALCAAVFLFMTAQIGSDIGEATGWAYLSLVLSLVSAAGYAYLNKTGKKAADKQANK